MGRNTRIPWPVWLSDSWRIIAFGFVLMFFSSAGQTYFIALFGGEIRAELGLTHGQYGTIYSAATLCSAICLLFTGGVLDWLRLRWCVVLLSCGLAAAAFSISVASGALSLFLALFLLRHFGQGLTGMCSTTTMMRYVPNHRAKANSLSIIGYSTAEAILPSVIVVVMLAWGWRQTWQSVALSMLVFLILALTLLRCHFRHLHVSAQKPNLDVSVKPKETSGTQAVDAERQWTRAEVIRDPNFYRILPGLTCQSLLYTGFMFHQVFLVEQKGWTLAAWASLYIAFSVTSIVMNFIISIGVDRYGPLRVIPWINLPMMLGLFVLGWFNSFASALAFMCLMAISTAGQAANAGPFYAARYGTQHLGSIKSLGSFVMVLMTALSPIVMGVLIDVGWSIKALAMLGIAYALFVSLFALRGCYLAQRD